MTSPTPTTQISTSSGDSIHVQASTTPSQQTIISTSTTMQTESTRTTNFVPDTLVSMKNASESQMMIANDKNQTIGDIKRLLFDDLNLDTGTLNNFANIPVEHITNIIGEPMVESVSQFFITADICQGLSVCDQEKCAQNQMRKELDLPNLFVIQGNPPYRTCLLGLPDALANDVKIKINYESREVSLKFTNVSKFQDAEYENYNISQFLIRIHSKHSTGLIPVTVTKSSQCETFIAQQPATMMFDPTFGKLEIKVYFIIRGRHGLVEVFSAGNLKL